MGLIYSTARFVPGDVRGVVVRISSKLQIAAEHAQAIVKQEAEAIVPIDTGELILSIVADPITDDGERVVATVSAPAPHSAFVEFGTGMRGASSAGAGPYDYDLDWPGMVAIPFMRPALDLARDRIREQFHR